MPVGFEVSAMKASFSLSSLEPSGGLLTDSPEHVRLRMEKPYNSLTKKPRRAWDIEAENWRRSWGGRDNEDSFLEALLPNYTYLMDNNLIDTCKEADGELCMDHKWQLLEEGAREGKASASQVETLCQEAVEKEIRVLRRWIRSMEKRLRPLDFKTGIAPSELEDKANEIQCLAVEVEARGKVVATLIRHCDCLVAASTPESQDHQQNKPRQLEEGQQEKQQEEEVEREGQHWTSPFQDEAASLPRSHLLHQTAKGSAAESLKVARCLEGRWQHLYLRAIEWQCHIETLLSGIGPQFRWRKERNLNGDTQSLDSGAEHSSFSSDGEEEDTCSGEEEQQKGGAEEEQKGEGADRVEEEQKGGAEEEQKGEGAERVEENRGVGVGGRARRVGGREDGGPLAKQPRLGEEQREKVLGGGGVQESEPSQVMEVTDLASKTKSFPAPPIGTIDQGTSSLVVKRINMKESPHLERVELSAQNCGYFVIRRIDTDSEAEVKENVVKAEEERGGGLEEMLSSADGVTNEGKAVKDGELPVNQDTDEEEGDEEDDEWVFSRVTTKVSTVEDKDMKSRKSLQYGSQGAKENQSEKLNEKSCGRVFEALKLNATSSDVGTKEKNARIKRWLSQGGPEGEESAESQEEQIPKRHPIDSCDASGEYTSSGESSEIESQSSGELDGSVATCRKSSAVAAIALATAGWNSKVSPLSAQELGISSLSLSPTDGDVTPVAETRALPGASTVNLSPTGKPVLRNKRRKGKISSHHQRSPNSEQKRRPWSICFSGPGQLVVMSSSRSGIHHPSPVQGTPYSASPTPNSPNHVQMHGARSTSESAIHCLAYSSSSCSTGLDDVGSIPGRVGTGSDGFTPTRGSLDGEGVGSGAGSAGTGSLRRKKVRTRRRTLQGQRSESGNSDSMQGESTCLMRRGSHSSSKGMSSGSKGSFSQSTSSDYSSSNMIADVTKDEVDDVTVKEVWKRSGVSEVPPQEDEDEDYDIEEEGEKLGSLQTEETSSYSEQAWDNYQVCLSEGGEYTSDDDKPAKEQLLMSLMEFGDDYRNHFDSQSDGGSSLARQPPTPCSTLDSFPGDGVRSLPRSHSPTPPSPGSSSRTGSGRRKRQGMVICNGVSRIRQSFPEVVPSSKLPPHFPLTSQGPPSLGPIVNLIDDMGTCNPITVLDSDSDLEEVNHFLRESRAQVIYTEGVMDKALRGGFSPLTTPGKFPPPADYAEISATCKENIKCLRALLRSVTGIEEEGTLLSPRDFWETRDLVIRWEMLESRAEECHLVRMLRQEIAALRDAMVAPSSGKMRNGRVEDLQNRKELDRRIQEVKAEIAALFELKTELLDVNVSVNRFLTGAAQPIQCPSVTTTGPVAQCAPSAPDDRDDAPTDRTDFAFLKDEVAELYREWDESIGRLNAELAALQRASRTWTELEEGLANLGSALDSDRNALTTLSTAVAAARSSTRKSSASSMAQKVGETPALLAASVRELARVLSEEKDAAAKATGPRGDKEEEYEWEANGFMEGTDLNGGAHISFSNSADPLGSLSDSGISDSGSEGLGMCERGRRLAALRKLARVLAATLGPNSAPLVALKQRMDDAQKELRCLQRTCRDLVVCTAMLCSASQGRGGITEESTSEGLGCNNSASDGVLTNDSINVLPSLEEERFSRLRMLPEEKAAKDRSLGSKKVRNGGGGGGGDDDDLGSSSGRGKGRGKGRKHWLWRALCYAMPFQLAVIFILYAAYFLEPHCCSALNNLSFSLSPQLHYVRGPPPT